MTHSTHIFAILLTNVVTPLAVGVLGFLGTSTWTTWRDRRRQSLLGAVVCDTILEELETGIKLLRNVLEGKTSECLLPWKSWYGMNTISDDTLERLLCLSKVSSTRGFPIRNIRTHLKNYFDHICPNVDRILEEIVAGRKRRVEVVDLMREEYFKPAEGVRVMVLEARKLLDSNATRWFPK
jgi:hypothetical protein